MKYRHLTSPVPVRDCIWSALPELLKLQKPGDQMIAWWDLLKSFGEEDGNMKLGHQSKL